MKKIFYLFTALLAMFILVCDASALKTSFDDDFEGFYIDYSDERNGVEIEGSDLLPGSTSSGRTYFKISNATTDNKLLYCANANKSSGSHSGTIPFNRDCFILEGVNANSIAYVYENGYGTYKTDYSATEYLTGDYLTDYFITQSAVWHFTVQSSWMENYDFTKGTFGGESNEVSQKIVKLINDAEEAAVGGVLDASISNTKMSLTNDGKYYISDPIKLTGKFLNSKISAKLSGTEGAFVTTSKDSTSGATTFDSNSTVYIKIPVSDEVNSIKITLSVSANTLYNSGEVIECKHVTSDTIQPMVIYYPNETTLTDSITVEIDRYPVKITKKDITNSEEVEGATLTIKKEDTVIETWTSTTTANTFYLEAGTYTLEETIAPEGYVKSTSKIEFVLDDSGKITVGGQEVSEIVFTNEPIIITISKISITGSEEIAGAKLKITDKDGNVVTDVLGNVLEWTSGTAPRQFNLKMGDYVLSETIAPEGYELSESTIEFTINDAGKVLIDGVEVEDNLIVFVNTPEPEDKPTGSAVIYVSAILGVAALGTVSYLVFKKYKK